MLVFVDDHYVDVQVQIVLGLPMVRGLVLRIVIVPGRYPLQAKP